MKVNNNFSVITFISLLQAFFIKMVTKIKKQKLRINKLNKLTIMN